MSTSYTRENFTRDVFSKEGLSKLRPEVKAFIEASVGVGWTAHVQRGHGVSLQAPPPNEGQYMKFSTTESPGQKNMTIMRRKMFRYANPLLVPSEPGEKAATKAALRMEREQAMVEERKAVKKAEREAKKAERKAKKTEVAAAFERAAGEAKVISTEPLIVRNGTAGPYRSSAAKVRVFSDGHRDMICVVDGCGFTGDNAPTMGAHYGQHVRKGEAPKATKTPVDHPEEAPVTVITQPVVRPPKAKDEPKVEVPEPVSPPTTTGGLRRVLHEGPMIAHHSQGKGYLSSTTGERKFSDRTSEFFCLVPGCEKTSESRLGIRGAHWRMHLKAGEVEAIDPTTNKAQVIDIPEYEPAYERDGNYTPRADRVKALARVLKSALEAGIDWTDLEGAAHTLAGEALAWAHTQSSSGSYDAAEREPLTAEERLERIRSMLDDGMYLSQREEIATLNEKVAELEVRTLEAEEDAKEQRQTLQTWRALIAEDAS